MLQKKSLCPTPAFQKHFSHIKPCSSLRQRSCTRYKHFNSFRNLGRFSLDGMIVAMLTLEGAQPLGVRHLTGKAEREQQFLLRNTAGSPLAHTGLQLQNSDPAIISASRFMVQLEKK